MTTQPALFTADQEIAELRELVRMAVWLAQHTTPLYWIDGTEQARRAQRDAYIEALTAAGFWKVRPKRSAPKAGSRAAKKPAGAEDGG